jgi:hypothetical protein
MGTPSSTPVGSPPGWQLVAALHLVLATTLLALAAVQWLGQRRGGPPHEAALLTYSVFVWVYALWAGPEMRLQVQATALVALAPLLARLRPAVVTALLMASIGVGWPMSLLFFGSALR